jgi:hypothetical protein
VTFDVVDLDYLYNTIFSIGFANKFNAAIHMGYLCMKILALHGTITVHDSQKKARNIDRAIYKSQRNINSIELANQEETKSVPLENIVLDKKKFIIGGNPSKEEEVELIETLAKNKDVFAWSASNLKGVRRDIIQHLLDINPKMNIRKQKQRKMSKDRILDAKALV